jgi:hypothetical protein
MWIGSSHGTTEERRKGGKEEAKLTTEDTVDTEDAEGFVPRLDGRREAAASGGEHQDTSQIKWIQMTGILMLPAQS